MKQIAYIPRDSKEAATKLKEGLADFWRFVIGLPCAIAAKILNCFCVALTKARAIGIKRLIVKLFVYWQGVDFLYEKLDPFVQVLCQLIELL